MVDFELARALALDGLSQTNTVEKIKVSTKTKQGVRIYKELWKVVVEIPIAGRVRDFNLFLDLGNDFPLSLPRISVSEEDYEAIKYIPHVDTTRNICLFDQDNIKIDVDRPIEIIKICLQKAVNIIKNGLSQSNISEFKDEVVAYWENTYKSKDKVISGYIGGSLEDQVPGELQVHSLSPLYNSVNLIIGSRSSDFEKLMQFFKMRGHKIEKLDAFFLGSVKDLNPPFYFDNSSFLLFIKSKFLPFWPQVVVYLNSNFNSKVFVFSIKFAYEEVFFGFYLPPFRINYNGWRHGSFDTIKIMSVIQPSSPVTRLTFKFFTKDRISKRTDGIVLNNNSFKFLIAGLGSIGSNLLFYLSGLDISKAILVDPDILTLENINRHLLSFNEVGDYKVNGIANYLTYKFPFIQIEKHAKSIVSIVERHLSSINEMDLLFLAVGKDAIEKYVLQCLSDGKITKPIVLLWVEPYLLGAHALYINPGTGFMLSEVETEGVYKYNIISNDTYNNPNSQVMLREAGCQGSYTPYGREAITMFFALILPSLFALIKEKPKNNIAWTCTGDFEIARSNNIIISDFGKGLNSNQLICHSM